MKVAVASHAQQTVPQAALARCEFSKPKRCWRAEAACRHTGDRSPAPRGSNRNWCIADAKARSCILDKERSRLRGLTFELSGRQRQDARPGLAKMYRVPPDRAWWPAVGAPLERVVRPHCLAATNSELKSARIGPIRSRDRCAHHSVNRQRAALEAAISLRPTGDW